MKHPVYTFLVNDLCDYKVVVKIRINGMFKARLI
jgi:hypothetical protein